MMPALMIIRWLSKALAVKPHDAAIKMIADGRRLRDALNDAASGRERLMPRGEMIALRDAVTIEKVLCAPEVDIAADFD